MTTRLDSFRQAPLGPVAMHVDYGWKRPLPVRNVEIAGDPDTRAALVVQTENFIAVTGNSLGDLDIQGNSAVIVDAHGFPELIAQLLAAFQPVVLGFGELMGEEQPFGFGTQLAADLSGQGFTPNARKSHSRYPLLGVR